MRLMPNLVIAGALLLGACSLFGKTGQEHRAAARCPDRRAPEARLGSLAAGDRAAGASHEGADFGDYVTILPVRDGYLVTYERLNRWDREGIARFNTPTERWVWRQPPVTVGRYTMVAVSPGGSRFVEYTGYPEEGYLAVHRMSNGRVLGRPWRVDRLLTFDLSGETVAAILTHAVGDREVSGVYLYNAWGRVVRRLPIGDAESLVAFPRGFAIVSKSRTTLIGLTGRRLLSLR